MAADRKNRALTKPVAAWGWNALFISVVLHVLLVTLAGFVIALRPEPPPPSQFVSVAPPAQDSLSAADRTGGESPVLRQRPRPPSPQPRLVPPPPANRPWPVIPVNSKTLNQRVAYPHERPVLEEIAGLWGAAVSAPTEDGRRARSAVALPSMLSGRCDPDIRAERVAEGGGSGETEQAVMRTLGWLQRSQNADGSWGKHTGAMTGLALLAFLGHCETPGSPAFGATVRRGIDYLVALGRRYRGSLAGQGGWPAYQHGIATYALAEAYAMTAEEAIAPVLRQAARRIIDGQTSMGGWRYRYGGETTDMSVASWQIQALTAVQLSGLAVDGLEPCLDRATACLLRLQNPDGGFPYHPGGDSSLTLTGAGVLGLQLWNQHDRRAVQLGLKRIREWTRAGLDYHRRGTKLYGWYYNTLACCLEGGTSWRRWHRRIAEQLVQTQNVDGSWPEEGGGILTRQAGQDAAHMRTCLCVLMLEASYRYLPAPR